VGLLTAEPFQMAYATNDIERACAIFAERFGIRQFRRLEGQRPAGGYMRVELAWVGPVMYELVEGHGPGTELFTDRLPSDRFVIQHHHIGHLVRDESGWAALEALASRSGHALVGVNHNPGFMRSGFVDAPELGHYLEYILPEPAAIDFFNAVPRA
jgi:hypothetical protein